MPEYRKPDEVEPVGCPRSSETDTESEWVDASLFEVDADEPVWIKATAIGNGFDPCTSSVIQDRRIRVDNALIHVPQELAVMRRSR